MRTRAFILGALLAATTAGGAMAAEAPDQELTMLGRCALASSVYRSLMPPAPSPLVPTDADKDLWSRLTAAEPLLQARADALASEVDPGRPDEIAAQLKSQFQAQLAPADRPRLTPREALDLYAPLLEACIVRAQRLAAD